MAELVILDAGSLIALLNGKDTHHKWAVEFFRDTVGFDLAMPALNYAETLVHPARANRLEELIQATAGLGLQVLALQEIDAAALAKVRAETNLKMPDAVVLQQAIKTQAAIATTDGVLAKAARSRAIGVFSPS